MSKIFDYLSECKVFYMATIEGDKPKLRPLGAVIEADGKIIFGVGDFKDVYKQMTENPNVEIVACKPDGHWLRYWGVAVFETDPKYANTILDKIPELKNIYNEKTNNKMMAFHLEKAEAYDIMIMGDGEKLL